MDNYSFLSNMDVSSAEHLYQQFLHDPNSVNTDWQQFFAGFEFARKSYDLDGAGDIPANFQKEFDVVNLINAYRKNGHLFTQTNPVRTRRQYTPTLDIVNFRLADSDLRTVFQAGALLGIGRATLEQIVAHLKATYCQSIGVEYMYIRRPEVIDWLQRKLEADRNQPRFTIDHKKVILTKLNQAVVFEQFLDKKFPGQKRFSLEGAEALIPALDVAVEVGSDLGIDEFVMGMAHRGRLNVMANTFKKTYKEIFSEFAGHDYEDADLEGDVKYHLGSTCISQCENGRKVKMDLCPNPSHLEAVGPVAQGLARARIDTEYGGDDSKVCTVLVHGDAAIAGQGVVYETIQMAKLDGYRTGGTIHIVINNQVGFTTNYLDGRSSIYCTDVAKTTHSPVFHVNGDDVEAVAHTMKMAMEYRQTFKEDVFVDLLCYRKYGHNEGDEPRFTQPILYNIIAKHPSPLEIYSRQLMEQGVVEKELVAEIENRFKQILQERLDESKEVANAKITQFLADTWEGYRFARPEDFDQSIETGVNEKALKGLAERLTTIPQGWKFFRKMEKILQDRREMVFTSDQLDWGMAEHLAYASLLVEGHPVRLSGQDCERGTFSHRHAVLKVEDSELEYVPLNDLKDGQAQFNVYNSLLSEYAVMGFDYGHAFGTPDALTIWEAQFGDFVNGAQIIIDQFICAAEEKWKGMNGLVLLLPHGYEGQGAEHSSARMERFLNVYANYNIQVVNCTTPANFFHVIRRQMKRDFRKPLIIFTPKSLLRHPKCVSSLMDLATGRFQEVIDDAKANVEQVERVVLCQGKIYYELLEEKERIGDTSVALLRLEQIEPLPRKQLKALIGRYTNAKKWTWVQEEPENMGAWSHLLRVWRDVELDVICRPPSGTPATGSGVRHRAVQARLISKVFEKEMAV
ncbi:MAG: 2-oxoglutarate dehydrogenase E1 component [Flavobacteriales bacterium]|nr:2-oxoglutarate dehydrogenase E1 component [Flavobacteriales bacterium]